MGWVAHAQQDELPRLVGCSAVHVCLLVRGAATCHALTPACPLVCCCCALQVGPRKQRELAKLVFYLLTFILAIYK